MTAKKLRITEALATNRNEIRAMLNAGEDPEFAMLLSSVALPRSIIFPGPTLGHLEFTHVSAKRFLTSDAEAPAELFPSISIIPGLAIMLQTEAGAEKGLVAQLNFNSFEVSRDQLADRATTPLVTEPDFRDYSLYQGGPFKVDYSLGGTIENSTTEAGPWAIMTVDILNAGCGLVRDLGHQILEAPAS